MPKYWVEQIFSLGRFPKVGQKQMMEREKREEKKRIANATSGGARKAAWANFIG